MVPTRRAFLAGSASLAAVLAGCSGGGPGSTPTPTPSPTPTDSPTPTPTPTPKPDTDGDTVPDGEDRFPEDPTRSRRTGTIQQTPTIKRGSARAYRLPFSTGGVLEYRFAVRDGTPIDAIVMPKSSYQSFKDRKRFKVFGGLSTFDAAQASVEKRIPKGEYFLVLDHSDRGRASPPEDGGPVNVQIQILLFE